MAKKCEVKTERSLSDHKILTLKLNEPLEYTNNYIKITNKKLAYAATIESIEKCNFRLENFLIIHRLVVNSIRAPKWKKLHRNLEYRNKLKNIISNNGFNLEAIKAELNINWHELWSQIQKKRFSINQKEAFIKIRFLKYDVFEKRDGSIITKVLTDKIIVEYEQVNHLLKEALEILTGKNSESTYKKTYKFPTLPQISIEEFRSLVKKLKKNKALASDLVADTPLYNAIIKNPKITEMFSNLWSSDIMNNNEMKKHLVGRLITLNKVHPDIPKPMQMRPIIALSPLLKILEIRFKPKLDRYLNEKIVARKSTSCG